MSRIGNKINAGYVATQLTQAAYMKQLLEWQGDCQVIDTCCGTGEFLKYLTDGAQVRRTDDFAEPVEVVTYGVEIDKIRGEQAENTLDNVIVAPIESCMISNDTFSFIALNPPYDFTQKDSFGKAERKEFLELERALRYLMPGGVLIYIVPYYRLADKNIARMLSTHFNKLSVARFTDENYFEYKQCMVIGHKKRGTYKEFNEKLYETFLKFQNEDIVAKLPTLADLAERAEADPEKRWFIPAATKSVRTFQTRLINKSKIANALNESQQVTEFVNRNRPRTVELEGKVPPLPLASGQIALLLASGGINGLMGNGDTLHLLRGQETVSNVSTVEETETGTVTTTKTKREVAIKIVLPDGTIKKLM